jgi:hypothetical protein
MARVFRYFLIAILTVVTISLTTGCASRRTPKQKFQVVSVDGVRGGIGKGWQLSLTVANNTASNLHLTAGDADIYYKGRLMAHITLDGDVALPRRKCSQVAIPLRLKLSNPLGALAVVNNIRNGRFTDITIDYSITVATFASHRTFSQRGVALGDIAQKFNYKLKN